MDQGIKDRFEKARIAKGIDWTEAARGVINPTNGRPIHKNYAREMIQKQDRGKVDVVEAMCLAKGISWEFVKNGTGPMLSDKTQPAPRSPAPDALPTLTIVRADLIDVLKWAFRYFDATDDEVAALTGGVLARIEGRRA